MLLFSFVVGYYISLEVCVVRFDRAQILTTSLSTHLLPL